VNPAVAKLRHAPAITLTPVPFTVVPTAIPVSMSIGASSSESCWAVHPGVNPRWQEKSEAGNNLYHIDFYLAWCESSDKSHITRWYDRGCWGHPDMEEVRFDSCNMWTGSAGNSSAPFEVDWYLHADYDCGGDTECHNYYSPYASGTVHTNPPSVTGTVYFN